MADAQPNNPATDAGTATQETVEQLKKELAEKSKELALTNAKFSTYEDRQRKQLAELQPTVAEFVKEGGLRERHCMFDTARFGRWTKSMFACFGTESMQSLASQHCARSLSHTAFF